MNTHLGFGKNSCLAPEYFECIGDKKCIPKEFVCDKSDDCVDKSDESHCKEVCV